MSKPAMPAVVDWAQASAAERVDLLARPLRDEAASVRASVAAIIDRVRVGGDAAVIELTREFDGVAVDRLAVTDDEIRAAGDRLPADARAAVCAAHAALERFHDAQRRGPLSVETSAGVHCERIERPIDAVGLYVPAGSAPLPSTVLMLGVPSALAGCPVRVLFTPPSADGRPDSAVLYAAQLCGIRQVFCAGGAQAIAAMAFGTETVPKVDKIFGPGNRWVTEAKQAVAMLPGGAACDMPAGPSELLVIADGQADAGYVAADLISQAEHGPDSQVLVVSPSLDMLDAVEEALSAQLVTLPRATIARAALVHSRRILCADLDEAIAISNLYAPEHLIVQTADARSLLDAIRCAGSVFLGRWSPESVGDYCSGTNHVLPTDGHARAMGGLSLDAFVKQISVQELSREGLASIGPVAQTLAMLEGLDGHARAVSVRLDAGAPENRP